MLNYLSQYSSDFGQIRLWYKSRRLTLSNMYNAFTFSIVNPPDKSEQESFKVAYIPFYIICLYCGWQTALSYPEIKPENFRYYFKYLRANEPFKSCFTTFTLYPLSFRQIELTCPRGMIWPSVSSVASKLKAKVKLKVNIIHYTTY